MDMRLPRRIKLGYVRVGMYAHDSRLTCVCSAGRRAVVPIAEVIVAQQVAFAVPVAGVEREAFIALAQPSLVGTHEGKCDLSPIVAKRQAYATLH
jgi:hypothetical protein